LLPQEQPEVPLITFTAKSLLISLISNPRLCAISPKNTGNADKKGGNNKSGKQGFNNNF
jgi:hypothetical protein